MTFVSHEDQQQREEALQQFKSGETWDAQGDAHRAWIMATKLIQSNSAD